MKYLKLHENWTDDDFDFEEEYPIKFKVDDYIIVNSYKNIERTVGEYVDELNVKSYQKSKMPYPLNHRITGIKYRNDGKLILKLFNKWPWYLADDLINSMNETFDFNEDDFDEEEFEEFEKFEKGDRVKQKENTIFYGQSKEYIGTIIDIYKSYFDNNILWANVDWDNGYFNTYPIESLILIKKTNESIDWNENDFDFEEEYPDNNFKVGDYFTINKDLYDKYPNWTSACIKPMKEQIPIQIIQISQKKTSYGSKECVHTINFYIPTDIITKVNI